MLKLIALAACVIGFVFVGPKALAEFRHADPRKRIDTGSKGEDTDSGNKPPSTAAA
jgi:hypothetical protein